MRHRRARRASSSSPPRERRASASEDLMLTQQLALVSESKSIGTAAVMKVAAALQKQATRDLAPIWTVAATVSGFANLEDVPLGYWPIMVMDDVQNAAGYHQDENGQPFPVVQARRRLAL